MQQMEFRGCFPFVCSSKNKLNPAFKRLVITSKNNNKAVSEILKIDDSYLSFCIDETANYLYQKLLEEAKNNITSDKKDTEDFRIFMNKYSKR